VGYVMLYTEKSEYWDNLNSNIENSVYSNPMVSQPYTRKSLQMSVSVYSTSGVAVLLEDILDIKRVM